MKGLIDSTKEGENKARFGEKGGRRKKGNGETRA